MLDNVNDELDDTNAKMLKLDNRLKGLLRKGSICKLWLIIIVEIGILIFLVSCL